VQGQRHDLLVSVYAAGTLITALPAVAAVLYAARTGRLSTWLVVAPVLVFATYLCGWLVMLRWSQPLSQRKTLSMWLIVVGLVPLLLVGGTCCLLALVP
jgi:hypothetical protein